MLNKYNVRTFTTISVVTFDSAVVGEGGVTMRKTCSIIVCLVVLMMSSTVMGEEYTPLYGVHTDFGLVSWYADGIRGFVEDCAEKGYSSEMLPGTAR